MEATEGLFEHILRRRAVGPYPDHTMCYFIVYGPSDVDHITNVLLPAIDAQIGTAPRHVYLMNYLRRAPLFPASFKYGETRVIDLSSFRAEGQIGYGESLNTLFNLVKPYPFFIILNPDTVPKPDFSIRLVLTFDVQSGGIVEGRQWPSEHPKEYDEKTGDTPWASGACLLVSSDAFEEIGGFDPTFFLYCEDVDLSWRMWLSNRSVTYEPNAICEHHTGLMTYRNDRYYAEHFYSALGFLMLCWKFFGSHGEQRGLALLAGVPFSESLRRQVLDRYHAKKRTLPNRVPRSHPMVKILGFNQFHEMRSA